ncbi:glutamine amidotransferase [Aureimonas sp. Leaf454]|uniref:glutamine amidotransferase n=1 Tax=Aureimonas sp. Leaf454 TaxID=1736381 RepID=UPI0007000E35|nr:glutamine amidotransferase [Aureimonas sp. Leaf454]KQT42085.1 glutamine amidotransferase [Aureimonas sp. Leaf454]
MTKTTLVLRHVHFEDLGSFAGPLQDAGYDIRYSEVDDPDFCAGDPLQPDLLVVLGGPVGVYEGEAYPFIAVEREFIRARLREGRPTLGVCLGAQLIASALGADVFSSGVKEIGFSPLRLTAEGATGPLRHLASLPVLHWHGDTYDLPAGAANLASTAFIENQAFAIGSNVLGLQFHAEVETSRGFERWLVGHAGSCPGTWCRNTDLGRAELFRQAARTGSLTRGLSRSCPGTWCRNTDLGRAELFRQAARTGSLTRGLSLTTPRVSSVM